MMISLNTTISCLLLLDIIVVDKFIRCWQFILFKLNLLALFYFTMLRFLSPFYRCFRGMNCHTSNSLLRQTYIIKRFISILFSNLLFHQMNVVIYCQEGLLILFKGGVVAWFLLVNLARWRDNAFPFT